MMDNVRNSPEMTNGSLAAAAGRPGKLSKDRSNIDGIRKLFDDMDVDRMSLASVLLGVRAHLWCRRFWHSGYARARFISRDGRQTHDKTSTGRRNESHGFRQLWGSRFRRGAIVHLRYRLHCVSSASLLHSSKTGGYTES